MMNVLIAINSYYAKGNGLSASVRRTVRLFNECYGSETEIRILTQANPDPDGEQPYYVLKEFKLPVFNFIVKHHGYSFASASGKDTIREAVKWADVVHVEEPFYLEKVVCKIAKEEKKPIVGTYHLHPENLFSSVHLGWSRFFNGLTMLWFRDNVFNNCVYLQCPTENTRQRLEKWSYKPQLRVISNGIVSDDGNNSPLRKDHDKFTVVSTGRLSVEKDQLTLLRALKYSKHAGEMKIVLAGRGPYEKKIKKTAEKLYKKGIIGEPVTFCFCSMDELKQIYSVSDIYVHCATVEVEGLSCLEAVTMGVVPIIAKGSITATSQFALSEKSVFKVRDSKSLALKIDYYFEHRDELESERKEYLALKDKYDIRESVRQIFDMYKDAVSVWEKER